MTPTVLQCKFAAYLSWSQPFIYELVRRAGEHVDTVVACNRTENLDRFPVEKVIRFQNRFLVEPRLALTAAAHLRRRYEPDLIHAHFGWSGLRMVLIKQFLQVPMMVTFGGRDVGVQMKLPYFDRLYEILLEGTDQIVCVSADLKGKLVALGVEPDRVRVIYRGTDVDQFAFQDRSTRDPSAPLRALMVGRLVEKKGHRYAFEAVAELGRRGVPIELVVVGEGEDEAQLRGLRRRLGISEQVVFAGSTDHEGVRRKMAEADVLIQCSITPSSGDTEGIPNVVVEAQATGLPIVGTRHGGIGEAVQEGESGVLGAERDVAFLTEALQAYAKDRPRRLDAGRAARSFVERSFNLESQVSEHVALYKDMVADAQARPDRMRRVFVPDDFAELVRFTIRNHEEFSLAELVERLLLVSHYETEFVEARESESRWERFYSMKRFVPSSVKFPVKSAVGNALSGIIEARYKARFGGNLEPLEEMDRQVLEYFRKSDSVDLETAHEDLIKRALEERFD